MEGWIAVRRCLLKPLPLSCLFHLAGILLLCSWLAHADVVPEELPEAEIVMEIPPDPLPMEEMPQEQAPDEPAPEADNPAHTDSGHGEEAAPLLQAMASSLAGTADDGTAQMVALPAKDPAAASDEKPPARQAERLAEKAAGPQKAITAADGLPAVPSGAPSSAQKGAAGGSGPATGTGSAAGTASGNDAAGGNGTAGTAAGDGSQATGTGTSSGSTESEADIAARFAARVEANKEYPYSAIARQQKGAVTTSVTLTADGSLVSASIVASSGIGSLDQSALAAVRASCPFAHGAGHSITIEVTTRFDLQE